MLLFALATKMRPLIITAVTGGGGGDDLQSVLGQEARGWHRAGPPTLCWD